MGPKFDKIALVAGGKVLVKGPFETHGEVVDDVVVRFLIIEDGKSGRDQRHGDVAQVCCDQVWHGR